MTDRQQVTQWLNDYIEAWKSYEREAIAALFSEDAVYRYSPFDEPLRGREAIIADWLENPDPPGSFTAEYHPVAVEGDTAVANGRTIYHETDSGTIRAQFDNIFVLRFDADGRCFDFCEWFMQPR